MRILLIEPDQLLGRTYQTVLEQRQHAVTHSRNAQQALDAINQNSPDLIILELQLPGHSGIEFLYELRSYVEWQHIPVLLHTLVPKKDIGTDTYLEPLTYLYKPTATLQQLVHAVYEVA